MPEVWHTGSKTGRVVTGDMGEIDVQGCERCQLRPRGTIVVTHRRMLRLLFENKWPHHRDICWRL